MFFSSQQESTVQECEAVLNLIEENTFSGQMWIYHAFMGSFSRLAA